MASRVFDRIMALGKARVVISGSFAPNGASTSVTSVKGNGFTVAHTAGGGVYTITLQDTYPDYDSIMVQYQGTASLTAQVTAAPDVASAKTIVVTVFNPATGAAVVDPAANAATRIHFRAIMKNTSGNF